MSSHTLIWDPGWLSPYSDSPRPRQSGHRILLGGREDFAHMSLPADLKEIMSSGKENVLSSSCKVPDIIPNFNQIWILSADFNESRQYQISRKSF